MEYKGFNVFMNEFKLMSTIVSADEMLQNLIYLSINNKVRMKTSKKGT